MKNIKKEIKRKIYQQLMEYLKLCLTHKLGKVEETEDKLICYVSAKKINLLGYILCGRRHDYDSLAATNGLNKQIVYVFNNIDMENMHNGIKVYEKCDLIFNNCKFGRLYIYGNKDCNITFNDCKLLGSLLISFANKVNIKNLFVPFTKKMTIYAHEISLQGIDDTNSSTYVDERVYDLLANDKIDIIDSTIGNKSINTSLYAEKEINVSNSSIAGMNIKVESETVNFDEKSCVSSTGKVDMISKNDVDVRLLEPEVYINGERLLREDYCKKLSNK